MPLYTPLAGSWLNLAESLQRSITRRALAGQHPVSKGTITLDGADITRLKASERARRGVAYVPQGRDIFPTLTVWENLKISLVVHGKKANGQVDRVLQLFPVLKEMLQRKGGVLSGGQQQQLASLQSLATEYVPMTSFMKVVLPVG